MGRIVRTGVNTIGFVVIWTEIASSCFGTNLCDFFPGDCGSSTCTSNGCILMLP